MISKISFLTIILSASFSLFVRAQEEHNYHHIDALHYAFHIEINDQNDQITATTDLLFKVRKPQLNFTYVQLSSMDDDKNGMEVLSVYLNEQPLEFTHHKDKVEIIFNEALEKDYTGTLHIHYQGIPQDGLVISENEYGDRTFFGDNWPNRAHYWLACIDHPGDKATCEFIVTGPHHYKVIANGSLREESLIRQPQGGFKKLTHWAIAKPIPTKVMVFGAAAFAVQHDLPVDHIEIQHWVYADNRESSLKDFAPTSNILRYLIDRLGDYPYEKLVNVESKTKYGGMENASNIFYNEQAVDGNQNIESLIAHEVAHQWFGNSVTERDWSHIWISEGFATYLAHSYIEHTYGADSLQALLKADKDRIFAYYQKSPQATVVDTTLSNLYLYLNAYSYQKGAWFLHMLRQKIGDQLFWKGIKQFYQSYAHAKADTSDFQRIIETLAQQSLADFFDLWLYQPGHPIVKGSWKYAGLSKKLKIDLEQVQDNNYTYQTHLEVGVWYKDNPDPEIHKLKLNEMEEQFSIKLKGKPEQVVLDPLSKVLIDTHLFSD